MTSPPQLVRGIRVDIGRPTVDLLRSPSSRGPRSASGAHVDGPRPSSPSGDLPLRPGAYRVARYCPEPAKTNAAPLPAGRRGAPDRRGRRQAASAPSASPRRRRSWGCGLLPPISREIPSHSARCVKRLLCVAIAGCAAAAGRRSRSAASSAAAHPEADARGEVRARRPPRRAEGAVRPRRAVRADGRRRPLRERRRRPARTVGRSQRREVRARGRGSQHGPLRLPPRLPRRRAQPGCTYEQWSNRITKGTQPTVYAHVAFDKARPGKLALQYWFFYVFNDFNNLHEGDWEMIQLNFDASSAEEALSKTPTEVGYSQHEGGERASWGDEKLELVDGTHPVVYPAAGSHANQFSEACSSDGTGRRASAATTRRGRRRQLRPDVKVVPSDEADVPRGLSVARVPGTLGRAAARVLQRPDRPEHEATVDATDSLVGGLLAESRASSFRRAACSARTRRTTSARRSPRGRRC